MLQFMGLQRVGHNKATELRQLKLSTPKKLHSPRYVSKGDPLSEQKEVG